MEHVHVSFLNFLITGAYLIVFSFLWRALAAHLAEKPAGKAMHAVFPAA